MKRRCVCGVKGFYGRQAERGWEIGVAMKTGVGKKADPPVVVVRSLEKGDIVTRPSTAATGEVISVTKATVLVDVWAGETIEQQRWPLSEAQRL